MLVQESIKTYSISKESDFKPIDRTFPLVGPATYKLGTYGKDGFDSYKVSQLKKPTFFIGKSEANNFI